MEDTVWIGTSSEGRRQAVIFDHDPKPEETYGIDTITEIELKNIFNKRIFQSE